MKPCLLKERVVVVIGATSGIGLSATRAIAEQGGRVLGVGRQEQKVRSLAMELGEKGLVHCADATDPATAEAAFEKAHQQFGRCDALLHVAGGSGRRFGDGPLHEISDAAWNQTLHLNLDSLFYSNRAAARYFLKQKRGGSILNIGSVLGHSPSPQYFSTHAYTAAKAALVGLTKAWAAHYARNQIRFNLLAPGLVATPMSERAQASEEIMKFIAEKQPLDGGRIGIPEDLDGAILYFLSDLSRFVTGQIIAVDGGWSVTEARGEIL